MEGSLREVSGVLKESKGVDFQGSKVGEFKGKEWSYWENFNWKNVQGNKMFDCLNVCCGWKII